ncbi:hypothetical protein K438DRAFT_1966736 [Mycena galopus ATCC 62051]|nr:hypothetical protein K438DRAFT_1966736 [Mycena galopus ATCC 62051]
MPNGNCVTDILYGDFSPSGHLPYTIGKGISDDDAEINSNATIDIIKPFVDIPYTESASLLTIGISTLRGLLLASSSDSSCPSPR